uniref:Lysosomal alpha-mannosidase n=1 Tax=Riptortus pedestris TaxID=329032 RepID=R4WK52_RIPPE|nr:lysosomal alpha-mannosidase [Riptortus pedestris]
MVHRRLTHDDAFGVGEALNETAFGEGLVARGSIWLFAGNAEKGREVVQERSVLAPWVFISPTQLPFEHWKDTVRMEFSSLKTALPSTVQILTLEPWSNDKILLRLEHISTKADAVTIDLEDLFVPFKVNGIREMTIDGNKKKSEIRRLVWNEEIGNTIIASAPTSQPISTQVTLKTMQIRTFVLDVSYYNTF